MPNAQIPFPFKGFVGRQGAVGFAHRIVLGASGAIASQDPLVDSGVVAAKTGGQTGRYTLTLPPGNYKRLMFKDVSLTGPDSAAYGAVSVGLHPLWRDNDVDGGAKDRTIELQFLNASTNFTDAELPTGTIIDILMIIDEGI